MSRSRDAGAGRRGQREDGNCKRETAEIYMHRGLEQSPFYFAEA